MEAQGGQATFPKTHSKQMINPYRHIFNFFIGQGIFDQIAIPEENNSHKRKIKRKRLFFTHPPSDTLLTV